MLYTERSTQALDPALFQNPPAAYRATPFWAWNCDMTPQMLTKQIDILKEMGLGGFHMHSRSGMAVPYLSDRFMGLVKACVEKARENGMLAWLYDEDRWPSGAAGGLVTKDERYRSRYLLFTTKPQDDGELLAAYAVKLYPDGTLRETDMVGEDYVPADNDTIVRYAYLCVQQPSPWYNNQAYLDTLNPAAVKKFIEVTHERYAECVGGDFGGIIPAMFTDEPQFSRKKTLGFAQSSGVATLPWTPDFAETFKKKYAEDILHAIPELFWELPGVNTSLARYHYHEHISERFATAFADQVGQWCAAHNLYLTGHMMEEPTLRSQTEALGEVMRSLSAFQLPGIDMLCDRYEYTTAKQAQSIAHQYGREGVLSELYGVTGWHFDFRGHKLQGDWQAALGVTVRVPHLSWVSMRGAAKRDYPASISYQSPWYKEYPIIEDHFARVNTALVRGKPHIRVGVLHPVESYWMLYGPAEQTHAQREELDEKFQSLTGWLLNNLIDFNYISEALLPSQSTADAGSDPVLKVGEMEYDVVIAPAMKTMRSTTVDVLFDFQKRGGTLIFAGGMPAFQDAAKTGNPNKLDVWSRRVPFEKTAILDALEPYRFVDVRNERGIRPETMLHQVRVDSDSRWLFLCSGVPAKNPDVAPGYPLTIRVKGDWKPTLYDTLTGGISPMPCSYKNGCTLIRVQANIHDSFLFKLDPAEAGVIAEAALSQKDDDSLPQEFGDVRQAVPNDLYRTARRTIRFMDTLEVSLSEPNVLLLDQADYALDGGEWRPRMEILRIDRTVRKEINYTDRSGQLPQPWTVPELSKFEHYLKLRFTIHSEVDVASPKLALESPKLCQLWLDGAPVANSPDGWFVDEAIETVRLPDIKAGDHALEVRMPIGQRLGPEWMYLLGDFGVRVSGSLAVLTPPVKRLGFGDWSTQGLPFYAGNVTYKMPFTVSPESSGRIVVEATQYRAPLLSAVLDGKPLGKIIFAPYRLEAHTAPGEHLIEITAYGNRANAFGSVHDANPQTTWFGPGAWQTEGMVWADEYKLWPTGVLTSPRVYEF